MKDQKLIFRAFSMPVCRTNTGDKMVLMLQRKRLVDADMPLSYLGILPTNFPFKGLTKREH